MQLIRDVRLATSKGFGRNAVPNWGRTDHGNATKHRNQTEVEGTHDSVVVVCRIVKRLNAEDGMGTYERLWRICIAELKSESLEGVKTRWFPLLGNGPT